MIYIRHAEVYTPYKLIKDSDILIADGKIKKLIAKKCLQVPAGTEILNAKDKIVCPGLIDVHVQGAGGYDFLDGSKEALNKISQTLAKFGTTSFLATTVFKNGRNRHIEKIVDGPAYAKASAGRQWSRLRQGFGGQAMVNGASLLGIHLEGPFVNPDKKGMIRRNGISKCGQGYFDKILKITKGNLKMMTIAPELKGAVAIIKKLRKEGIVVSLGHSDAGYEEAMQGIKAGITHATHIFNAMRPMHHREPGALTAILTDDRISVQLISDGVHIHPAIIRLIVKLKGAKNIVLITDSMSSQGLPDGRYVYDGWEYESRGGVCRYKDGTLIGTSLPLNKMLKRMVKFSGASLLEAVQMATINPARILGIQNRKGAIEEGMDADLVIMDKDLEVVTTIIGGNILPNP